MWLLRLERLACSIDSCILNPGKLNVFAFSCIYLCQLLFQNYCTRILKISEGIRMPVNSYQIPTEILLLAVFFQISHPKCVEIEYFIWVVKRVDFLVVGTWYECILLFGTSWLFPRDTYTRLIPWTRSVLSAPSAVNSNLIYATGLHSNQSWLYNTYYTS